MSVSDSSRNSRPPLRYVRLRAEPLPGLEREHAAALKLLSPVGVYRVLTTETDGDWAGVHLRGQLAPFNAQLFEEPAK